MNGVYGHEFTRGFQVGDTEAEHDKEGASTARKDDRTGPAGAPRYTTLYWKAAVVAKHFAAYSLETSTIPDPSVFDRFLNTLYLLAAANRSHNWPHPPCLKPMSLS